jgi:NAD(P) transhydrogenase subunit alpha
MLQPWRHPVLIEHWARRGVTMVSLDRVPRLPQAHGLDPTTTQARIVGRQAVLLAEQHFGGSFPMIASDGVVRPVSVLVLGAGAVGLQAMSSAHLLDADVTGYTGRQGGRAAITSRGARFLDLGSSLTDWNGIRWELRDQERQARQHALDIRIGQFDVVITAAGTPGRRPPRLVDSQAIARMRPGSVIVDIASSRYGGNVAGSRPGTTLTVPPGVSLIGAANLASLVPGLASEYFADNVVMTLLRLCVTGRPLVDLSDPLWSAMVLGHRGRSVLRHPDGSVPSQRPILLRSPVPTSVKALRPATRE